MENLKEQNLVKVHEPSFTDNRLCNSKISAQPSTYSFSTCRNVCRVTVRYRVNKVHLSLLRGANNPPTAPPPPARQEFLTPTWAGVGLKVGRRCRKSHDLLPLLTPSPVRGFPEFDTFDSNSTSAQNSDVLKSFNRQGILGMFNISSINNTETNGSLKIICKKKKVNTKTSSWLAQFKRNTSKTAPVPRQS